MGLDAVIYIRSKTPEPAMEDPLLPGFTIQPLSGYDAEDMPEATHEVDCGCTRFYGEHYERGPWPRIAATLMELLASEDVEKVWYGSDCEDRAQPIDAAGINAISAHYMAHGQRPYRREGYRQNDEVRQAGPDDSK